MQQHNRQRPPRDLDHDQVKGNRQPQLLRVAPYQLAQGKTFCAYPVCAHWFRTEASLSSGGHC